MSKLSVAIAAAIKKLTGIAQDYVTARLASEKTLNDNTTNIKNLSTESERITKLSESDMASGITIGNKVNTSKQAVIDAVNTANSAAAAATATVSQANSDVAATTLVQAENAINDAKSLATSSLTTITGYLTNAKQSSLYVNNSLVSANTALSYAKQALIDATTLLNQVQSDAQNATEYTTLVNAANDVKNFVKIINDTIAVTKSTDTLAKLNNVKDLANQAASDADATLARINQIFKDGSSTGTIIPQQAINDLTQQVSVLNAIVVRITTCVSTLQSISDTINNTITFINTSLVQTETNITNLITLGQNLIATANAARSTADAAATASQLIFQQLGTYHPQTTPLLASSLKREGYQYPSKQPFSMY